jgi:hypothetical protein
MTEQLTVYERTVLLDTLDTCRDAIMCLDYAQSQGFWPTNAENIRSQAERNAVSLKQILGITPSSEHVGQGSRTGRPELVRA